MVKSSRTPPQLEDGKVEGDRTRSKLERERVEKMISDLDLGMVKKEDMRGNGQK